jgi:hypothetical protein
LERSKIQGARLLADTAPLRIFEQDEKALS